MRLFHPAALPVLAILAVVAVAGAAYWLFWPDRDSIRSPEDSAMLRQARQVSLADARKTARVGPYFVERIDADLSALPPDARKQRFIQAVLPLVARENDRIRAERAMLATSPDLLPDSLFERYGVAPGDIAALRRRVDIVPAALVIAQAALESGWGTSRFALEGNNIFGMRTYRAETPGIAPAGAKGFKVIRFNSLGHGVDAYMRNLNTNTAYRKFREIRAASRKAGRAPTGVSLAQWLTGYSEIPEEYGKRLRAIIARERLSVLDQIRLAGR